MAGNSCVQIIHVKLANGIDPLKSGNLEDFSGKEQHFKFLSFFFVVVVVVRLFFKVTKWRRADFNGEAPNEGEDNSDSPSQQEGALGSVPQPPLSPRLLPEGQLTHEERPFGLVSSRQTQRSCTPQPARGEWAPLLCCPGGGDIAWLVALDQLLVHTENESKRGLEALTRRLKGSDMPFMK